MGMRRASRTRSRRWSARQAAAPRRHGVRPALLGRHHDELQAVERDVAVLVARHWNSIFLDAKLFARIDALYQRRDTLGLDPEALRVLERYHLDFVRAGAKPTADERERFGAIVERLATLGTQFGQNVLGDEQETVFALYRGRDRRPARVRPRRRGRDRPRPQAERARRRHACRAPASSRSCISPPIATCAKRCGAPSSRAAPTATRTTIPKSSSEIVALRAEQAKTPRLSELRRLQLADSMAGTLAAARGLLEEVWAGGRAKAEADRDALQDLARAERPGHATGSLATGATLPKNSASPATISTKTS